MSKTIVVLGGAVRPEKELLLPGPLEDEGVACARAP